MEDDLGLEEAIRLAEELGAEASARTDGVGPEALAELSDNLCVFMDQRFQLAGDIMEIEEAVHIAFAYVAWSNGFRITGTQLALSMQMVECSLAHVLPRAGGAGQGVALATQCLGLVAFVQNAAGHVESYRSWCAVQSERLRSYAATSPAL